MPLHNSPERVRFAVQERVLHVTLAQPARRNAISDELLAQLVAGVRQHHTEHGVRVMVLAGEGGNFCAGRDLNDEAETGANSPAENIVKHRWFADTMVEFAEIPLIKIAVIEGHAVGAGLSLAAACDLRYAAPDAKFSIPELDLGYPFAMGGVARLVRHVGLSRAAELVLSGRRFTAEQARGYGMLSNVGPLEDYRTEANTMAITVADRPALVLAQTARALRQAGQSLVASNDREVEEIVLASLDEECQQAATQYATRFSRKQAS